MAEKKNESRAISFDEARNLRGVEIVKGLKIKGAKTPFGGSWSYDPAADEITLVDPPTKD